MLVLEEILSSDHPASATRVVINRRKLDLAYELLVVTLKLRCDLRAVTAYAQGSGEGDDIAVDPDTLTAVEVRC